MAMVSSAHRLRSVMQGLGVFYVWQHATFRNTTGLVISKSRPLRPFQLATLLPFCILGQPRPAGDSRTKYMYNMYNVMYQKIYAPVTVEFRHSLGARRPVQEG